MSKRVLTLRLKARWWNEIQSGRKLVELRVQTAYWRKRLNGQQFDEIHLWCGYPPRTETAKLLRRKFTGVVEKTITHEEFGPQPVDVFEIDVSQRVEE